MTVIRFADVTIDTDARDIRRGGSSVEVQPQVFDVLMHLIEHRNRVVSKEELLDAVWKHRFVTESALTSRIKSARQAIGDNGRDQRMIKTLHGRGYRFVADVVGPTGGPEPESAGEPAMPSVARSTAPRLPVPATPFVGREFELGLVTRIVADPSTRLVTVLGPGGMGKTRLALAVAELVTESFDDGVWFVPLAPVSASERVPQAIADALGVPLDARRDPVEQLHAHVGRRSLLLVLDNVEHVLPLDVVSGLLDAAPGLRILATSRERIGTRSERVYELGGLGWSPAGPDAGASGAVDLFIRTAHRAKVGLVFDDAALESVQRICRLVGGMPLAIELAAGWSDVLSVAGIAGEIERGLAFLETDLRDVPERHRSIRAVCESSWARLDAHERDVFMRLSVFRGGCSRADAEAVAGATLPTLRRLAATSMISVAGDDRCSVHEVLRQFGEGALADAGLLADVRRRHSEHFLAVLAARARDLKGGRQLDAVREIATDLDNVRAAWSFAAADRRVAAIEQAVEALWLFFDTRGNAGAMVPMVEEALMVLGGAADVTASGPILTAAHGIASAERGDLDEARASLEGAAAELGGDAEHRSAGPEAALVHLWLGWVDFLLARNDDARTNGERGVALFGAAQDRWGTSRCRFLLANVDTALGRLADAQRHLDECCDTADAIGDVRTASLARRNRAILAGWFGDHAHARSLVEEVLAACRASGDRLGLAYALRELGKLATAEGHADEAVALLRESIAVTDALENQWESAATEDDLGNALAALGDLDAAEAALRRCLDAATAADNRYYVARCVGDLGALAARRGDAAGAMRNLQPARAMWEEMGHEPYLTWVLVQLAHVTAAEPDGAERAVELYTTAAELALRHGLAPFALEIAVGVAELTRSRLATDQLDALGGVAAHPAATAVVHDRATALLHELTSDAATSPVVDDWRGLVATCLRRPVRRSGT